MYEYVYICMYVCIHIHTYISYVCMYVRMYVCMYVCMHVCMYTYTYIFIDTYIHTYVEYIHAPHPARSHAAAILIRRTLGGRAGTARARRARPARRRAARSARRGTFPRDCQALSLTGTPESTLGVLEGTLGYSSCSPRVL